MRIHCFFKEIVKKVFTCGVSFIAVVTLSSCGSVGKAPQFTPKKLDFKDSVNFRVKNRVGVIERNRIQSQSITETFEDGTLRKEEREIVDFLVESKVSNVDEKGNTSFVITTLEKQGPTNLQDLAFPEAGESLEVTLTPKAKVLKAGTYPETSLFYIPPISFPDKPVKVGETWTMNHKWISMRNALNMEVDVVSIFKAVYECGVSDKCAEIEISGAIKVNGPAAQTLPLKSEIVGRLLVHIDSGSLIWSDIRNHEELMAGQTRVRVRSCMETVLSDPVAKRWAWRSTPACDPLLPVPDSVPGM